MIIATPTSTVVIRPGQAQAGPVPGEYAAARFARIFDEDVFALQGAEYMEFSLKDKESIKLAFRTLDQARMADAALKDTVLGVHLLYIDPQGNPYDTHGGTPPRGSELTDIFRNLSAMPGVTGFHWNSARQVLMIPESTTARVRLQELVDTNVAGVRVYWKGQCSGPKCPPDPPPPA